MLLIIVILIDYLVRALYLYCACVLFDRLTYIKGSIEYKKTSKTKTNIVDLPSWIILHIVSEIRHSID